MSRILCCLVVLQLGLMTCVTGAAIRTGVSKGDTLARELLRILVEDAKDPIPDQPAHRQADPRVDAQIGSSRGTASAQSHQLKRFGLLAAVGTAAYVISAASSYINTGRSLYQNYQDFSSYWWKRELGEHGAAKVEVTNFSKYPLATSRISDRDGSDSSSKLPGVIRPAFEEAGLVGRESSVVLTVLNPESKVDIMVAWSLTEGGELSMAAGTYTSSERQPNNKYADWYQLLDDPSSCHGDAECTTQSARVVTLEHCGEQGMCVYIMGSVNAEGNPVIRLSVVPEDIEDVAEAVREEVQDLYG